MERARVTFALVAVLAVSASLCAVFHTRWASAKAEAETARETARAALAGAESYRVRDSLSAARCAALTLQVGDLQRYRAEEYALAKEQAGRGRDVAGLATAATKTETRIVATVRDSVVRDTVRDTVFTVPSIEYADRWLRLRGVVDGGSFRGTVESVDSLTIVEAVRYKRFLWWKTRRVKSREWSVSSKNPHTQIRGFEVLLISR